MSNITTEQTIVSLPLRRIFQGEMFTSTAEGPISAGATVYYGIVTLDYPLQFGFEVSFELEADMTFFKDATFTGGTSRPTYNVNGTSTKTMDRILYGGPSVTDVGTLWSEYQAPISGGTVYGNTNIGGRNEAYILAANSKYLLRLIDGGTGTPNEICMTCGFFKHV